MNAEKSAELYARAVGLMPGGVNSPVRAMGSIGRDPIFVERAEGNRVWDFQLKDDIRWEDGSPITCADVKYGVERSFSSLFSVAQPYAKTSGACSRSQAS